MIHPVILSGGSGTRLWPLSRDLMPKQLLSLFGEESLLAATARRVTGAGFAAPVIVCNKDHRVLVQEQLAAIGVAPEAIIIEPAARNTAPAIAAAAALLQAKDQDAKILVLPSDHIIRDVAAFHRAIAVAAEAADCGRLVTFGITPTAPETGYGYISSGEALSGVVGAFRVARFVEKPDLATAAAYLADGKWSWNSGMFVFPVGLLLDELAKFEPDIVSGAIRAVETADRDGEVLTLGGAAFAATPSKSIDYALMEPTALSVVVPASLGWSDVGSWSALWEIGDKDNAANLMIGDVMAIDTEGAYIRSEGPLVAALGLKDIVIVATGDVVLAASRSRAQDVKSFVARLKERGRSEATAPSIVRRRWGAYQIIDSSPGHRVRRLTVKAGRSLPRQSYGSGPTQWVVVSGACVATCGGESVALSPGLSLAIPEGAAHGLENPGPDILEMIEVRTGAGAGTDQDDERA
jgi:mannose-1-phosphate guanylyltransferase/mannose-1-phosphate guanylyltransferase/mannose-6-phosphate isomerase